MLDRYQKEVFRKNKLIQFSGELKTQHFEGEGITEELQGKNFFRNKDEVDSACWEAPLSRNWSGTEPRSTSGLSPLEKFQKCRVCFKAVTFVMWVRELF